MDTDALLGQLKRLEEKLLAADATDLEQLLADDFVEIGSSGRRYNKTQILAALSPGRVHAVSASEFTLQPITPDAVLLLYRSVRHSQPPVQALRSSLWQRSKDGAWQLRFHQGTPLPARPEP